MSPKVRHGVPCGGRRSCAPPIRCLARDGYTGLTMKKVAREARVSQGILHYYFARQARHPRGRPRDRQPPISTAASPPPRSRRAPGPASAPARPRPRLPGVGRRGPRGLDRLRRVLGRDDARPAAAEINAAIYARTRRLIGAPRDARASRAGAFRRGGRRGARPPSCSASWTASPCSSRSTRRVQRADAARFCDDAVARYLAPEGGVHDGRRVEARRRRGAREYFRRRGARTLARGSASGGRRFEALETVLAGVDPAAPPAPPSPASGRCRRSSTTSSRPTGRGWTSCGASWPASARPAIRSRRASSPRRPSMRPWSWLLRELRGLHRDVLAAARRRCRTTSRPRRGAARHGRERRRSPTAGRGPLHWVEDLDWKAYAIVLAAARHRPHEAGEEGPGRAGVARPRLSRGSSPRPAGSPASGRGPA